MIRLDRLRETAAVIIISLIAACVIFFPCWNGSFIYSGDFSGSDLLDMNFPRRVLAAQAIRCWHMPHWTPTLSCGLPLLAEGQAGVFYPFGIVPFLLFPPVAACNAAIIVTLAIASSCGYALGRSCGLSKGASAITGVAFGFSSAFLFRLKHLNMVQSIAWLPLSWALVLQYLKTRRHIWPLLLAAVWCLQILAGHPHVTYISVISAIMLAVFYSAAIIIDGLRQKQDGAGKSADNSHKCAWKSSIAALAVFILCGIGSAALGAVQLLPTYELSVNSVRSGAVEKKDLNNYPFTAACLQRLINPYINGNPAAGFANIDISKQGVFWENTVYIGIIPLILALGSFKKWQAEKTAVILVAAVSLAASLSPTGLTYDFFRAVCPGFNKFRFPCRFLIPFTCSLALLAGFGAENLLSWLGKRGSKGNLIKNAATAAILILTFANLYWANAQYQSYLPVSVATPPASIANGGRVANPGAGIAWQYFFKDCGWKGSEEKITSFGTILPADLAAIWGVQNISDHVLFEGGMAQERILRLNVAILKGCDFRTGTMNISRPALNLIKRMGADRLTSFMPIVSEDNSLPSPTAYNAGSLPQAQACPLPATPRVRLAGRVIEEPQDIDMAIKLFQSNIFDPDKMVMLKSSGEKNADISGNAAITNEDGNRITIDADVTGDGYLVLLDTWYPGWKAFIDGKETEILRADIAFRAVRISEGHHTVEFIYKSTYFTAGLIITIMSMIIWLGALGYAWRREGHFFKKKN
ncbi:MAG: YfhO family protein [bacterium]|nr:YfhO family protein [bacterium]